MERREDEKWKKKERKINTVKRLNVPRWKGKGTVVYTLRYYKAQIRSFRHRTLVCIDYQYLLIHLSYSSLKRCASGLLVEMSRWILPSPVFQSIAA